MTRHTPLLSIFLVGLTAILAGPTSLLAHGDDQPKQDVSELRAALAQEAEPKTVTINLHTYGLSVSPKGQASLLTLRLVGPKRILLLDQRTTGESIDWSLPGSAPDGSYRYEAFVSTTATDGQAQSSVTPGGFEVQNGQILQR